MRKFKSKKTVEKHCPTCTCGQLPNESYYIKNVLQKDVAVEKDEIGNILHLLGHSDNTIRQVFDDLSQKTSPTTSIGIIQRGSKSGSNRSSIDQPRSSYKPTTKQQLDTIISSNTMDTPNNDHINHHTDIIHTDLIPAFNSIDTPAEAISDSTITTDPIVEINLSPKQTKSFLCFHCWKHQSNLKK